MRVTREMAATARCPECDAAPYKTCVHTYGRRIGKPRSRHHNERVELVRRWEEQHELELQADRERAHG